MILGYKEEIIIVDRRISINNHKKIAKSFVESEKSGTGPT